MLYDKEIHAKRPLYSLVSAVMDMNKTVTLKGIMPDQRKDDIYLEANEGEEFPPPSEDNIGRKQKINNKAVVATFAVKD